MRLPLAFAAATLFVGAAAAADTDSSAMPTNAYDFSFHAQATALYTADRQPWNGPSFEEGQEVKLSDYAGHPILVVNTAAHCGFTPQFESLQAVWDQFRDDGLMVIGVHENDFGAQGGTEGELAEQCGIYNVDFPQMQMVKTVGADSDAFYMWVRSQVPVDELREQREGFVAGMRARGAQVEELSDEDFATTGFPSWNFNKVLISAEGDVLDVFNSGTDIHTVQPELIDAIEGALGQS